MTENKDTQYEVLYSNEGLSFWGGIDPTTGIIIDQMHPLCGLSVADKVLCIPSGRGSCTGSQVMLELILNGKRPSAIVLRDIDAILCTGAIIADEVFYDELADSAIPPIYAVGEEKFSLFEKCSHVRLVQEEEEDGQQQHKNNRNSTTTIELLCSERREHAVVTISAINLLEHSKIINDVPQSSSSSSSLQLKLTPEELSILHGKDDNTPFAQTIAMRVICRVAIISSAHHLIPIKSAHIDGCTFIGQGGLQFAQRLVHWGGEVSVPTTLNSVSADRRQWDYLGVDPELATNANAVGDAYLQLGCDVSFTCAPYLLPSKPSFGDNIIWGESNAVVFANSILGARTDKYADYFDICAALVGRVPNVGVHLDENRIPGIVLDTTELVKSIISSLPVTEKSGVFSDLDSFFPTMGWLCGYLSDGRVPLILGVDQLKSTGMDNLKAFSAAFGTTGTAPLFHMAGITPEAINFSTVTKMMSNCKARDTKVVTMDELRFAYESLDSGARTQSASPTTTIPTVDLVALGNPHLSVSELARLVELTQSDGTPKNSDVRVMATLSRHVQEKGEKLGYIKTLQNFGIEFVNDTCWCMMMDPPIIPMGKDATIMTNSGKYAHYGPGLTRRRIRFGSMADCISIARSGQQLGSVRPHNPSWLNTTRSFASIVKRVLNR